jgi:hypothetical protein
MVKNGDQTMHRELKAKSDRTREGIDILIKLRETGVKDTDEGMEELKEIIRVWINTGEYWSGSVEFPAYDKKVEGFLPRYVGQSPVMVFKMKK